MELPAKSSRPALPVTPRAYTTISMPPGPSDPAKSTPDNPSLEDLRRKIDTLDDQIVPLLNARAQIVVEIGKLKQQSNVPIYAPDREKAVLEKVRRINKGPLSNRCLEAVY